MLSSLACAYFEVTSGSVVVRLRLAQCWEYDWLSMEVTSGSKCEIMHAELSELKRMVDSGGCICRRVVRICGT